MKTFLLTSLLSAYIFSSFAQDSLQQSPLSFSGYLELYYQYDGNNPVSGNRPSFIYSFNRNNEVAVNMAFIKASYNTAGIRGSLALMTGTYTSANLAEEPDVLKHIYEANIGLKLSRRKEFWLDAGVFSSHIGFESAVGKDCWNLTRSILAENSPYYETGVKVGYTSDNGKWFLGALLLNGWQHIRKPARNTLPSAGWQVSYKPSAKISLNSSSFIGNDQPDSSRQLRYFHNCYGIWQLTQRLGIITGFDVGAQQKAKGSSSYAIWYSPVVIVKYATGDKTAIAVRCEYYADAQGVMISTSMPQGFKTTGLSANFDYAIRTNVLWRIEAKQYHAADAIFTDRNNVSTQTDYSFATALSLNF